MKDFTLTIYSQLLQCLIKNGYTFQTMQEFIQSPLDKSIIMRHDVDRNPNNALKMAQLENEPEVNSNYYFRTIPKTFQSEIIMEIASLGHEIGYHYECLANTNGNYENAIKDFRINLEKLRKYYPVKTICMHGSPISKWDSRLLWEKYNYQDYGIIAESNFDIDFKEVLYITDAGRSWNNENINRRDKVNTKFNFNFNHTNEIIKALDNDKLPDKIMINVHPEHWTESTIEWYKIWCIRKLKNTIKKIFLRNK